MQIQIEPIRGHIEITDHITLPPGDAAGEVTFILNSAFLPQSQIRLEPGPVDARHRYRTWRIYPGKGNRTFTLNYAGTIQEGVQVYSEAIGKNQQSSRGHIGVEGVFLDGASTWYPQLRDSLQTFRLRVALPDGWLGISQGQGSSAGNSQQWSEKAPQNDIYLIAAPFTRYHEATPFGEAQVFLRQPDAALAQRYLGVTADYLNLYSRLIGPYPYAKFAVVENFWESGYGMPSFTLLGPRVLRLPFILRSSYPHEILHNWWGNSVYVDYATGNWSEGLTAYLADHLFQEMEGQGAQYRREALKRYSEFARAANDFPLQQFTARNSEISQAVGYDKALMVFHMLRRDLGDGNFIAGLQRFYREYRFKTASFTDLLRTLTGDRFSRYEQWLLRPGAPLIELGEVSSTKSQHGYQLSFTLNQTQREAAFTVHLPVAIQLEERAEAVLKNITLTSRKQHFNFELPSRPQHIAIDPEFDTLRRLAPAESPPTLARLFAAQRLSLILPAAANEAQREGYLQLARDWSHGQPQVQAVWDNELKTLPRQGAVWVLGWHNLFAQTVMRQLPAGELTLAGTQAGIAGEAIDLMSDSVVFATIHNDDRPLALLAAHDAEAIPGLARKVPHYGKYSYLTFQGPAPDNRLKGQWQMKSSPLQRELVPQPPRLLLPKAPRLTDALD